MATGPHPSDAALPENTRENLERKLDHAIEETFPTSDPVSVTITKGGAIDYDEHGKPITRDQAQESGGSDGGLTEQAKEVLGTIAAKAPEVIGQAKDTLGDAATAASNMAREAYDQGQRYARQAAERYPQPEGYYREGTQAVREYMPENPLWTLLLGAVEPPRVSRRQVGLVTRPQIGSPSARSSGPRPRREECFRSARAGVGG